MFRKALVAIASRYVALAHALAAENVAALHLQIVPLIVIGFNQLLTFFFIVIYKMNYEVVPGVAHRLTGGFGVVNWSINCN